MPLRLVRAPGTAELWRTMTSRFLSDLGDRGGPQGHGAHLWLRDRRQRDLLLEEAKGRGLDGWLGAPFNFWTDLPELFGIRVRPIGLLTRRALISRISREVGESSGLADPRHGSAIVRGHMLDKIFSDLLPEGIGPDALGKALDGLTNDDFGLRRNAWVLGTYRGYLQALDEMGRVDLRSLPSMMADAIDEGGLPAAIGQAPRLHIYGMLYDLRSRKRFAQALMDQTEVDVAVYALAEAERGPWDSMGVPAEIVDETVPPLPSVQPAPDGSTEAAWVTSRIKKLLVDEACEPHDIAVIARSGREDTRTVARALSAAGVPVTVRARAPLSEISALKAFLALFEAAEQDWSYRSFRACVMSPYFHMGIRGRTLDRLAGGARICGLTDWRLAVETLMQKATEDPKTLYGSGLFMDHLETDLAALRAIEKDLAWLGEERTEQEWVQRTLDWIREGPFLLRVRLCEPVGDDWDVVRFDQRGVLQLERLLREWLDLAGDDRRISTRDWHRLFKRLLSGSELALSTPMDKGVQVLEAPDATLIPFEHVFVVHANHGEFPRESGSGGVFSDEERTALAAKDIPILHRTDDARRERMLWSGVTALEQVTVLYRTTSFQGTPLLPSLLVPVHDENSELPRTRLPKWDAVTPGQHLRQIAVRLANEPESTESVASAEPNRLRHGVLSAYAESIRPGVDSVRDDHLGLMPNPWNGRLSDTKVIEYLAKEFGPNRVWSASQLESYATCPFNHLIDKVLNLHETGQAEEETTALTFGGVAHEILERYYASVKDALPVELDGPALAHLNQMMTAVLEEQESSDDWLGDPVLWRNTRAQMEDILRAYVAWELEYIQKSGERPLKVELAFGFDGTDAVSLTGPDLVGELRTIKLRGRIDRVDVVEKKGVVQHLVLDYKSSNVPAAKGYKDGSLLQGALYVEVINTLGYNGVAGRYRALKKPNKPKNGAAAKVGQDNYAIALAHAMSIPGRILTGRFEPVMAASKDWAPYHAGPAITRSQASLPKDRSRFDE